MPRKLRVQYSDAVYHLMNRGDRREAIFTDTPDRERFLDTLGEVFLASEEAHAERLLQAELRRRGWKEGELSRRGKGDHAKLTIAWRLRQETTMTLKWIAQRLHMWQWTYLSNCLLEKRKKK